MPPWPPPNVMKPSGVPSGRHGRRARRPWGPQAAGAALRAELDRARSGADRHLTQALSGAARERQELRAELDRARQDAARLAAVVKDASDARIGALEAARGELLDVAGRLAEAVQAAHQPPRSRRAGKPRGARGGPTKREQMIELAGQRTDLATVPLAEVSKLAGTVAAEIGYSPGTARRELVRHVRELQGAPGDSTPDSEGGQGR